MSLLESKPADTVLSACSNTSAATARAIRGELRDETLAGCRAQTRAIHAGRRPDPTTGAILTPIHQATTYVQEAVGVHKGHTYSRASNPTVSALEEALAAVEGATCCTCYATGMAAIAALCQTVLSAGDHAIISEVVYGGTVRLFRQLLSRFGVSFSFVDTADLSAVERAFTGRTKLVLIETPANPTLRLTDIAETAKLARKHGALLAVDNTFLTAALQRPLELGADVVVYSTTKYIEGHNSTVGGAVVSNDAALHEQLLEVRKTVGSIQSPFEAWLTLRGLTTLPIRIRQHSANALKVAQWLEKHPRIERVSYPGLNSFAQHELAKRQQDAFGGIVAFEVKGGTQAGIDLLNSVRLCSLAENLGAVETLITHPATMTHGCVPPEERLRLGITEGLVRLSVGLEDPQDIIDDLNTALTTLTKRG